MQSASSQVVSDQAASFKKAAEGLANLIPRLLLATSRSPGEGSDPEYISGQLSRALAQALTQHHIKLTAAAPKVQGSLKSQAARDKAATEDKAPERTSSRTRKASQSSALAPSPQKPEDSNGPKSKKSRVDSSTGGPDDQPGPVRSKVSLTPLHSIPL